MSELKQDLGLFQGIGLLSTSLLGTGVFVVPALAAQIAGSQSLWAWPLLLALVFPIAITFAALGRQFPHAGGAAHFVEQAFGARMAQVTGWLFLSVIPVALPAALQISSGFWHAAFGFNSLGLLAIQIATISMIWLLGLRSAGSSANVQSIIAMLVITMVIAIWWQGDIRLENVDWSPVQSWPTLFDAIAVMFWCFVGIEAFAHLASEFHRPAIDFPRALIVGLIVAGCVYWGSTVAVLHFASYGSAEKAASSLPAIVTQLFGSNALWIACIIGYLACFASMNIYSHSFARLAWSQAKQLRPDSWLAKLSTNYTPVNALTLVSATSVIFTLVSYYLKLSLDMLLVYANGIFILIYFLCMLAGLRLLKLSAKIMALIGSLLSLSLLVMIGWKSLYALGMFSVLWLIYPYVISNNRSCINQVDTPPSSS